MSAFFVAGIGLAVFIEFLLISKKNKTGSDKILTLWMFLILVHLFLFYIFYTGDILRFPFLLGVGQPFPLLQGVFLYLYVASLTDQLPKRRGFLALHFVPALIVYAYLIPFFLLPGDAKLQAIQNRGEDYELYMTVKSVAISVSGLVYVVWSELLLRRHERNIRERFSDVEKIDLVWLKVLTYGLGAIWFVVIFFANDLLIFGGVVVFVFLIGFFGVRQTQIFSPVRPPEVDEEEPRAKYQKSGLSEEAIGKLHEDLKRMMAVEAVYKKSELSITDLATRLGVHPNYLSQVINQKEGKNFYDFVNSYRIEEFKNLISQQKNQQFTLLSLAYDCGFSSKTSFNRVFKKATGQTPTEYAAAFGASPTLPS